MDIEIVVKGGVELSEYYPKNYEAFEEKIGELIMKMFPGVGGWCISPEPTKRHQEQAKRREQHREEDVRAALIEVLKEPEFQNKISKTINETPDNERVPTEA